VREKDQIQLLAVDIPPAEVREIKAVVSRVPRVGTVASTHRRARRGRDRAACA